MLRWSRKGLLALFLALLVLAAGYGDLRPSNLDLTVSPYKYSLAGWEVSHFLDKWVHKLADLMPWTTELSRDDRIEQAKEFFNLGRDLRELERRLLFPDSDDAGAGSNDAALNLRAQIEEIKNSAES